jgi:hypothetical protein
VVEEESLQPVQVADQVAGLATTHRVALAQLTKDMMAVVILVETMQQVEAVEQEEQEETLLGAAQAHWVELVVPELALL